MTNQPDQKKKQPWMAESPLDQGLNAFHQAAEDVPDDAEEDMGVVTTSKAQREEEEEKKKKMAGFRLPADVALPPPEDDESKDDDVNLKGDGWIKCPDGTWIKDKGGSVYIKGHPPTEAQIQAILAIAAQRNWGTLAVWKPGGRMIDDDVTHMFEARGCACCHNRKEAGSFNKDCKLGMDLWKETVVCQREAQRAEEALAKAKASAAEEQKKSKAPPQPA